MIPVNIGRGAQFEPAFLAISPNNRIPAIVDRDPEDGGDPISVFESGAILLYLAEKTGRLIPRHARGRKRVIEWLMWQMSGLGPMLGQAHHFRAYAPETIPYAVDRYTNEANRLYGVLDKQLEGKEYIAGDFSIADIACWPWIVPHERQGQKLEDTPHLHRWFQRMQSRPAVRRGLELGAELRGKGGMDEKAKQILFGQTARR
jgi:GST-like protein